MKYESMFTGKICLWWVVIEIGLVTEKGEIYNFGRLTEMDLCVCEPPIFQFFDFRTPNLN